ncbi:MAG: LuxR C-terminal-related transcriptional regulator [Dehalococcoidia bacterium]
MRAGTPVVALVTGAIGSGRSTLLARAAAVAEDSGFRVAALQLPGPMVRPSWARPEQLAGLPRHLAGPQLLDWLLRSARLEGDRWLLLLDDAHVADPDEVASLASIVAGSGSGVLLLLAASADRDPAAGRTAALRARLSALATLQQHQMSAWTGIDVNGLMLSNALDSVPTTRFGFELAQLTSGNAALVRAYTDAILALDEDERLPALTGARRLIDVEPPQLARDLIRARLEGTSPAERRLLHALAVWGLPADVATLALLADEAEESAEALLDALEAEGHVRARTIGADTRFSLADGVTRAVLARDAPSLLATRVHRIASERLAAVEVTPAEGIARAAHHLAVRPLNAEHAAQVLRAARDLLARGRHVTAREYLEAVTLDAVSEDLPADLLVEAVQSLAEAYTRASNTETAERLVQAIRVPSRTVSPSYLRALLGLSRTWLGAGREVEAESTLRYLTARPRTPRDVRFQAGAELVRLEHWRGYPEQAMWLATELRRLHPGEPDAHAQLWFAEALVAHARGDLSAAVHGARRALWLAHQANDAGTAAKALAVVGECWLDAGSVQRALVWLRGAIRRGERSQAGPDVAWIRNRLIPAAIEAGEWTGALASARRGRSQAASINLPHSLLRSEAAVGLLEAQRGRVSPRWLRAFVPPDGFGNPLLQVAIAITRFEQQRTAGLHEHAYQTARLVAEELAITPGWERFEAVEVLPRLAQVFHERGDACGLQAVLQRLQRIVEERPRLAIGRVERDVVSARLAVLEGRPADAATGFELARHQLLGMGYRWRAAELSGALGRAQTAGGQRARAVRSLREGIVELDAIGAAASAGRLRDQLSELGGRAPRATAPSGRALTPRQREVALLAARGLSDREIGIELGMTRRTATTHMSAILRRLNLRSRYDLAHWLDAAPPS